MYLTPDGWSNFRFLVNKTKTYIYEQVDKISKKLELLLHKLNYTVPNLFTSTIIKNPRSPSTSISISLKQSFQIYNNTLLTDTLTIKLS